MEKITEQSSSYDDLEKKSVGELLECMNREDRLVPEAVGKCLPQIEKLIAEIVVRMKRGGRLFYIGAGTSGRLGILDASEVPPTFGVPHGWVVGLIAGGDRAIRRAVEAAEDQLDGAWNDLSEFEIGQDDVLVGIPDRKYPLKIRDRSKTGTQHDYDDHDDPTRSRQREQIVRHAVDQRETR